MGRVAITSLGLALAVTFGCAAPEPARYPMWEPLSLEVPAVPSSKQARRWLAQSRDVWRAVLLEPVDYGHVSYTPPDGLVRYSYVRAYQVSLDEVEFTAVSVENGRVILRALLTADPTHLRMNMGKEPTGVATRWVELGAEVGARDEGAPALTIDALYDQCEALLREDEVVPRLYFHANGLLMSCGYPDGRGVAIQSFSRYPLFEQLDPASQLCSEPWGLFPPLGESYLTQLESFCLPAADARFREPLRARRSGAEPGLEDICDLDPKACPKLDWPSSAGWTIVGSWCSVSSSWARAPNFLDFGKRAPLTDLAFPFLVSTSGIECGRSVERKTYQRRANVPRTEL
jgi:hypothetical protein